MKSVKYLVTLELQDGTRSVQEVVALNKDDAEYRAAVKAETVHKKSVSHVVRTTKL